VIAPYARDAAATCGIFGFFAAAWFGWGQEAPPAGLRVVLIVGAVLAYAATAAGLILARRHRSDGTVFDARTSPRFGIVVGIEFVVAGIGAAALGLTGHAGLISAWVAFVVGVHLFPVAVLLRYPFLHLVAAVVAVAAVVSVPLAHAGGVEVSAVTGSTCGTVLLLSAAYALATVRAAGRRSMTAPPS
jgi:hypothetical protein